MRRTIFIAALLSVLASCAVAAATSTTTVGTHRTPRGRVLSTSRGFSLYTRSNDKQGGKGKAPKSMCKGKCAKRLRPLLVTQRSKVVSARGVNRDLLGTVRRPDGSTQVTYNGWPLYTDVFDSKPGEIEGYMVDQFGARTYLLTAKGQQVKGCPSGYDVTRDGCLSKLY